MNNSLIDFHSGLCNAGTASDAWELLLQFARNRGLEHLNAWFGTGRHDAKFLTNRPKWWTPHYLEQEHYRHDHLVRHFFVGRGMLSYGLEKDEKNPKVSDEAVAILREAREGFNLGGGVAFPLFKPDGSRIGGVNIANAGTLGDFDALPTSDVLDVISATTATLTAIYSQSEQFDVAPLSGREEECLLWLAGGLRTKEIAEKLNLSDATVTFHINNAKRKLGAETREQAVARAVALGKVYP